LYRDKYHNRKAYIVMRIVSRPWPRYAALMDNRSPVILQGADIHSPINLRPQSFVPPIQLLPRTFVPLFLSTPFIV